MEMANWLISIFVGITLFVVYVMEYLRHGRDIFKRPEKAMARAVDPHVFYTRRRRIRN